MSAFPTGENNSQSILYIGGLFIIILAMAVAMSSLIPKYQWLVAGGVVVGIFVGYITASYNYRLMLFLILITLISTSSSFSFGKATFYLRFILIGCFSGWELLLMLRRKTFIHNPTYMHFAMFFLVIVCFTSSTYSLVGGLSFQRALSFLLLFIAIFISVWNHCSNRERMEGIFRILAYTAMVILLLGIVMLIISPGNLYKGSRFQSIFSNPNAIGAFCTLFTPMIYWIFSISEKRSIMRYVAAGLLIISAISIILSGSRASFLGTSVAMLIVLWSTNRMKLLVSTTVLLICVVIVFNIFGVSLSSFGSGTFIGDKLIRYGTIETGSGRSYVWEQGWAFFLEKPLSGWGFGISEIMFRTGMVDVGLNFIGGHFHNSYLEYLVNLGVIGALPAYSTLLFILFCSVRLLRMNTDSSTKLLAAVLLGSFSGGMINAFFESWMVSVGSPLCLPFWLVGVLLVKLYVLEKSRNVHIDDKIIMELRDEDIAPAYKGEL